MTEVGGGRLTLDQANQTSEGISQETETQREDTKLFRIEARTVKFQV